MARAQLNLVGRSKALYGKPFTWVAGVSAALCVVSLAACAGVGVLWWIGNTGGRTTWTLAGGRQVVVTSNATFVASGATALGPGLTRYQRVYASVRYESALMKLVPLTCGLLTAFAFIWVLRPVPPAVAPTCARCG